MQKLLVILFIIITITIKRKLRAISLETSCTFFVSFLNKLYEAIIKRKLQHCVGTYQNSRPQAPSATILFYIE